MFEKRRYSAAFFGALTLFGGFAAAPVASAGEGVVTEEIVVTGSRLKQSDLTAISPVATVTQEQIQMSGVTRIEDLLNNMPQVASDFGGSQSNGSQATATVNLRGLGAQRTLVLVNSRRLMPGDPTQNGNSTPDLNQIPAQLIERVEVLTGGASAVYGADAVAGVVNFIMQDDFEGLRFDVQTSGYSHENDDNTMQYTVQQSGFSLPNDNVNDGGGFDATMLLGINKDDGTGNATFYLGYRHLNPIKQAARDYSACSPFSGDNFIDAGCGGSSTTAPARFQQVIQTGADAGTEIGTAMSPRGVNGALIPYDGSTMSYNYAPLNYYQRPDKRYIGGAFAHLEMNEYATIYGEFQFMDDKSDAQIAPAGAFRGSGGPFDNGAYGVNCDNPYLDATALDFFCTQQGYTAGSSDVALISVARRGVEGGGRSSALEHTSYRGVLGVRGDFADVWSYDVYAQYGTTNYSTTYSNDYSKSRIGNSLQAVDDGTGNIVCLVNADTDPSNNDPGCVPWNIFQPGGVTEAALAYVSVPGFQNGSTTQTVMSGAVNGDLTDYGVKLPWANEGVTVAIGAEYREEKSKLDNDVEFATGDLIGQGGKTLDTNGNFHVKEIFMEARVPIVSNARFAREVSIEGGYRYSDYNLGFDTDTYKLGADWMPIDDIRFRYSYQRAVRAPNIQELYRPQVVQLDGSTDPCAVDVPGVIPAGFPTAAECARSGVTAAQYGQISTNPAGQYNGLTGGDPTLNPEKADTITFGFVFTPTEFLPELSLSVDYFDIKIDDVINGIGADLAVNQCVFNNNFCDKVVRAPSGSLWLGSNGYVIDLNENLGSLQTRGVDIELSNTFELPRGLGSLGLNMMATWVDELTTEPLPGFPKYDCVGLFGNVCGVPIPEWRHISSLTWTTPWSLDLIFRWRYMDAVNNENTQNNSNFSYGAFENTDKGIDAQNYYDIAAQYQLDTRFADLTFRGGVNNVLDTDPPIFGQDISVAVYVNGNTFPQAYDTLGRYWFLSATAHF
jgi:iron complex outermembrane recepter protein